mmetsp:Transcript_2322/g.6321  ORF Transcript_2322/g.6321 Transcript_2322/m.6321 type:complete len:225 (-) Transcript_2322:109-783(-)
MEQGGQDSLANKHGVRTPLHAKALIEELDHKQLVMLRDGRKIVGLFRSCDQFANLVFQNPYERIIVANQYCDIPLGSIYLVRGENVVLMGRVVSLLGPPFDPTHPPLLSRCVAVGWGASGGLDDSPLPLARSFLPCLAFHSIDVWLSLTGSDFLAFTPWIPRAPSRTKQRKYRRPCSSFLRRRSERRSRQRRTKCSFGEPCFRGLTSWSSSEFLQRGQHPPLPR